jgi:predicted nucleotidyltransferase
MMNEAHKTVVKMVFGSQLYGTSTPASDTDYKGIYLPSMREMMLGRVKNSFTMNTKKNSNEKNTSDDVDMEFYSLQYFFELAKKGETVALDMLHAPLWACTQVTPEWSYLVEKRKLFYTKNLSSLVGYARRQAAKYGVKGSRLAEVKAVLAMMNQLLAVNPMMRVRDAAGVLPKSENCGLDGDHYNVCGRKLTMGAYLHHYVPMLEKFVQEYGERAKAAESNEGVDWKAISHAFRAAYQVRALLTEGDFSYPLRETAFLLEVKTGKLHFKNEVAPELDALMSEVEALSAASTLPEKVDDTAADNLLLDLLNSFQWKNR